MERKSAVIRTRVGAGIAALALMLGLGGAVLAGTGTAEAQTGGTATGTATVAPTAPTTGSGLAGEGGPGIEFALVGLGALVLGGGVVLALAGRPRA